MGYSGAKLRNWFDDQEAIEECCRETALAVGKFQTEETIRNTPVETGHLRRWIEQKPLHVRRGVAGERVYETGAETEVEYAPYVEHGTGLWGPRHARYEIRPKRPDGWLRWIDPDTGEPVFAKRVMHPGSPGSYMFALGTHMAEHMFPSIAEVPVRVCMNRIERSILRHRVVVGRRS
jgi:hypothetical protein